MDLKLLSKTALVDCTPEKAFWVHNGSICRNIYELASTILAMDEETFRYHVNDDNGKNDFAAWVYHVLGDGELGLRLHHIREKDRYVDIIEQRIRELEAA